MYIVNMIAGKSKSKIKIYYANVNVDLMKRNLIQINVGITINVYVSLKNVMYEKKIIFRILLHVVAKMENI